MRHSRLLHQQVLHQGVPRLPEVLRHGRRNLSSGPEGGDPNELVVERLLGDKEGILTIGFNRPKVCDSPT